jgi:hypothetical protein
MFNADTLADQGLSTPERNNFFYGKLMDAEQFRKDHSYFNRKRWLLNRLVLEAGVLWGLGVETRRSAKVQIQPGVAIDKLGREIIVTKPLTIDPRQPTDESGTPKDDPITKGTAVIAIAYAEFLVDPVPVLVPSCDTGDDCAPSTIREEFRIRVQVKSNPAIPPPDPWLWLAEVNIEASSLGTVDASSGRALAFNNAMLSQLVERLEKRISTLERRRMLRYTSGDGQVGQRGQWLEKRLGVQLVDGGDHPVAGEEVRFRVLGGGGVIRTTGAREELPAGQVTAMTNRDGMAEVEWQLGEGGTQEVEARAEGTAFAVTFSASISGRERQ